MFKIIIKNVREILGKQYSIMIIIGFVIFMPPKDTH